jgi:uncharacterized protein YecE (DUF72 family)
MGRAMGRKGCEIRIGTSGWHYDHWKGTFYPDNLPKKKWLEYYAGHFNTVEINNTFYHLPRRTTVQKWREQAPKGFLYVVKANRYITHVKKLRDAAEPLERFFEVVGLFGPTLGPILYQLPPSLHKDLGRLGEFIKLLPTGKTAVFEFRHRSWYDQEIFDLLDRCHVGFCVHDMQGSQSPRAVTGDIVYVRFHGTSGRYAGNYSDSTLQEWADWIKALCRSTRAAYVYFNNDVQGHAVNNAKTLRQMVDV